MVVPLHQCGSEAEKMLECRGVSGVSQRRNSGGIRLAVDMKLKEYRLS
jgi:hypothetical protein